jgi:rod shape-determining protein MreD
MPTSLRARLSTPAVPKINRAPSPVLAVSMPWLLVMLGSLSPILPWISTSPVMPPLGFMILVAWLQMRPGLFPVWAGLPLGLFDDLFSGQPFGSGILLWSLVTILLDFVEVRFPWRGFLQNWLLAAAVLAAYLLAAGVLASGLAGAAQVLLQLGFAVVLYPLVGRIVGMADRLRLVSFRAIG